ncbi:MAG: extracellular solute-binding protein, partial [Kiritimatiellae bacterium]|nr:extracellular solute-binding protein [Kiritimatiellia bacterium]
MATLLLPLPAPATGWVERTPSSLTVHLTLFDLPDPARTDPATRAELAVQREYLRLVPDRLAARAAARGTPLPPDTPPLRVQLHRFSGIQVEGVESTLLAIAGNVAPDVLYVNFRQSQTYIDQGFLAPLDDPADAWFTAFSPSEVARRVHPAIDPVIRRPGPDGATHVWALPSGPPLSRVVLFRRDLFDAAGLPSPSPSWTWDDFLADCRALADPARGVYAIGLSRGKHESYLWLPFLWGAGGEALAWDPDAARWNAVFDTPEAASALDFYLRLTTEPWTDSSGRPRRGYAIKDTSESSLKWRRGQLAMMFAYLDSNLFASLNPDLTGMAPLPVGPARRGTEINSRMMGLFAGTTNPLVRDAAWEYIAFQYSPEAEAVRVRTLVEGGMARFVAPDRLSAAGYPDLASTLPPEWTEIARVALAEARPEPYGQNANVLYDILTEPIRRAEELALSNRLPTDPAPRLDALQSLLHAARLKADAIMLGRVPPRQLFLRRLLAALLLLVLLVSLVFALRRLARSFLPQKT